MSETTARATISIRADLLEKAKEKAGENFQSFSSYVATLINKDSNQKKKKAGK
jgi:hypothetical protein